MSEFKKSKWKDKVAALEFIENADIYILERQRLFKIMKSLYNYFLADNSDKTIKVLELGCGDGRVTHELLQINADLEGTLIDGSSEMIENAKKRLKSYPALKFMQTTFQELVNSNLFENFDFIVSSLAIHHLQKDEKKILWEYVYNHLNSGGFFLNIDVIRAPTESLENWYLKLWKEWIVENETKMEHLESFQNIPDQYKNNPDNNPDTLESHLNLLKSTGFKNVDCYYKYGIFSVYGGQK